MFAIEKKITHVIAGLLSIIFAVGFFCVAPRMAYAQEQNYTVIEGEGAVLDFDNPPALPEGMTPPAIGTGVELLGETDGFIEVDLAKILAETCWEWAKEKGINFASNKLLSELFGNKEREQMNEVLAKQDQIMDLLTQMINTIKMLNYQDKIDEKNKKMNSLWERSVSKQEAIASPSISEQQRKDMLKEYFNDTGDNYVMQVIDLYVNSIEGKGMLNGNVFDTYDAYALYNFYWENEGYDFRASLRVLDIATFYQMWAMAYAVCEAHIQDNTPQAPEARAAQARLLDCISKRGTGRGDLKGFPTLLAEHPVTRLEKYFYTFQVPGMQQKLFIPDQSKIGPKGYNHDKDAVTNAFSGWRAFSAVDRLFRTFTYNGRRHNLVDYFSVLEPIKRYYQNTGKGDDLLKILLDLTKDPWFEKNAAMGGFLQDRGFCSKSMRWSSNDYQYTGYCTDNTFGPQATVYFWLDAHNDDAAIRKCIGVSGNNYIAIFNTDGVPVSEYEGEDQSIPAQSEVSDAGVVTAVDDGRFTLTMNLAGAPVDVTEDVLLTPETQWEDGFLENNDLADLLNCAVEIDGTYSFADGTLSAKTIRIKDDSGVHEFKGTIVSNVANAVMIQSAGGSVRGYFLPDMQEDIPLGSRVSVHYHWENGSKIVDSYELLDEAAEEDA